MIEKLFIAKKHRATQTQVAYIEVVAGEGIIGDRHYGKSSWPGQNITLIAAEEIEKFNALYKQEISLDSTRRNIITRGIHLNELVGKMFKIGDVTLLGVELCEPCAYFGSLLENENISMAQAVTYFVNKGGLRADIVSNGKISVGMNLSNDG